MTCPNIYLGSAYLGVDRFSDVALPAWYHNDAIVLTGYDVTTTYDVPVDTAVGGYVRANNHGTDDSPSTRIELYWWDPATNFPALPARRILQTDQQIPGATIGPSGSEGALDTGFTYTFSTLGHFCLLARLDNNGPPTTNNPPCSTEQHFGTSSPPTDPLQAIHNINVVAPPPSPSPAPGGAGGAGFMAFGFAATNMQPDVEKTQLHIRVLDPGQHRQELLHLVANPNVDRALSRRGVKFAVPNGVRLGEGRERILYRREHIHEDTPQHCIPRIGSLGQVNPAVVKRLLAPGEKLMEAKKPRELELIRGEARQIFLEVEPCGREHVAYAVEVNHVAAGRAIGGLVCIFVPPHRYL